MAGNQIATQAAFCLGLQRTGTVGGAIRGGRANPHPNRGDGRPALGWAHFRIPRCFNFNFNLTFRA